jgi:hypothetical protein
VEVLRENEVEMSLAGKPRWWTVRIKRREWELVRVDYSYLDERAWPLYVFLPPDAYSWPPLVACSFKMGTIAFDEVEKHGGKVIHYPSPAGKALELKLLGWKR